MQYPRGCLAHAHQRACMLCGAVPPPLTAPTRPANRALPSIDSPLPCGHVVTLRAAHLHTRDAIQCRQTLKRGKTASNGVDVHAPVEHSPSSQQTSSVATYRDSLRSLILRALLIVHA